MVELPLAADGAAPAVALAGAAWGALAPAIAAHLAADGLPEVTSARELLGLAAERSEPHCLATRRAVLASPPSVSVVVPVVDRPEALRRCLAGLIEQTYPAFEVIVVDNAPRTSGAPEVVEAVRERVRERAREEARDPLSMLLIDEPRRGASAARNRGLAAASGDLVAFLDGDARPDAEWLAATVTALTTPAPGDDRIPDCATGLILPAALETPSQLWLEGWGGYAKGFEPRWFDLGDHRPPDSPLFPFAIAICGSGASLALRRSVARRLGGFDVALGGGTPAASGEDLALLLDVVASGGLVAYEPRAIVWHEHPATEARFRGTLRAYGTGLTAYLTRHVARHPLDAARIAARLPAAAAYFVRPDSAKNRRRPATFPGGTWREELAGMAVGPIAYLLGRRAARDRVRRDRVRGDGVRRDRVRRDGVRRDRKVGPGRSRPDGNARTRAPAA
jgi:GT2 family glycosyltransferase